MIFAKMSSSSRSSIFLNAVGGLASGGLRVLAGRRAAAAAAEGAASEASSAVEITFRSAHGARHLAGTGLEASEVESAILRQVSSDGERASLTGSFRGRITVAGRIIEYRGFTTSAGKINIGTYFVP